MDYLKIPFLVLALILSACGVMDGNFGIISIEPEKKECWDKQHFVDTNGVVTINYKKKTCNGSGHDVEYKGPIPFEDWE